MIKQYQVTITDPNGAYRPVSCIIVREATTDVTAIKRAGLTKICLNRGWDLADLKRFGYTKIKIREYDKEKIEAENKARYEAIKEEKYASGEWKRPKAKN